MTGRAVDEYRAPLFFAWQLTNRCSARCIACCEESGPDKGWRDELTRAEALDVARRIADEGIPYVAFGGGEPLGAPHCWDIFELLAESGVSLKLETDGSRIDADGGRPPGRACGPMRADLRRWRDGRDARARASRVELCGGHRRHRTAGRARAVAAARLRPQPVQYPRDCRCLRSRGRAGLRRIRHGAPDAHRPRGGRMG